MLEVRGVTKRRCNKTTSEERLSEVGYFVEACSSDLSLHLLSLTVSLNQSIVVLRRKESVYRFLINWQRPQGNWKVAISTKHNNLILLLWPKITGMECPEGKSLPLSGESSSSSRRDYEVFLSFRGPDTRLTITDSLYAAMIRAGICVFKDDEELRVGEEIRGELLRAISNSKIYVPIFSENYASSKWCLRELAHMVECRKRDKKLILPIFYGVDASNLKLRTGSYGKALRKHERRFGEDMAKHWEEALIEVAGIKGYNLKDHSQDKLIAFVLEEVFGKLMPMQRNWCDGLVGIHDQMETVMKLLAVDTFDVRFVVIHGMGGIGKTTLVKAIFKRISSQFQSCSFLSDIRESDILNLQKKLLHDILGIQHPKVMDANEGRDVIKQKLGDKKAFIVLDDMDKRDKLMNLAGESSWFGSGSRIIITTRNTYFLAPEIDTLDDNIVPMHLRDFSFHEMKQLQFYHALQLFSKHSFASDSPPQDYIKISHEIVETTGRLPLALEVIGSLLHSKGKKTWKNTLQKLREVPHEDVQKKLLISYKELEYEQQQIFLDIACHCIGEERIPAYYMWKACEFFPITGLHILIHLSLIKVSKDDRLWMHNQLRDLGREIVQQECFTVPGKRSRLWCPTIALEVVQNNMGTDNIIALKLTRFVDGHNFTSGEFSRLPSLRFLELNGGNFVGDFKNLLSNLTWLSWHHCPSNLRAIGLCLRKLAFLKLSKSNITEDWNGWGACMVNDNLKVIYLTSCNLLKRTPNFSKCMNLKKLVLKYCTRLEEIDSTINQLGHLKCLEISGEVHMPNRDSIPVIRLIPKTIGGLKSLLVLKVEKHDGVIKLPHSIGELFGLKHLSLHKCHNLRELPDSIGDLRSLLHLDLSCTGINALPDSIGRLELLLELALSLTKIVKLPYSIGNLKQLQIMNLSCTKIRELPKSIWILKNLEKLYANNCKNLKGEIPSEISGLSQLKILDLSWTKVHRLPVIMNRLFNLRKLDLWFCMGLQLLPNLPTGLTKLRLVSSSLQAAPNLSNLTNLDYLAISDYDYRCELSIIEQGQILHLNLEWLERLHKLQTLIVVLSNSNMHPIDLSSLSQLEDLEIACTNPRALTGLPSRLVDLTLRDVKIPIEWSMFSNLGNLSRLKFFRCRLREIEFDNVLGQLEILQHVEVSECKMLVRLSNLSSLKEHQVLSVNNCPQLIEIKSEPSSTGDCSSTERPIPDALKLEKLCRLRVVSCKSLQNIPNACHKDVLGCPLLDGFDDQSVVYDRERMGPVDLSGLLDKLWASP